MRKLKHFIIVIFVISNNCFAQNSWQTMMPDLCSPKEVFKSDSILHVFVSNGYDGAPWLYVLDLNGNYKYSKEFFNLGAGYIVKKNNNAGYIMAGSYASDSMRYRTLAYYDNNLDSIWSYTDSTVSPIGATFTSIEILNSEIICKYFIIDNNLPPNSEIYRYCRFNYSGDLLFDSLSPFEGHLYKYNNNRLLTMQQQPFYSKTKYIISDSLLNIIDSVSILKQTEGDRVLVKNDGSIIAYADGLYSLDSNLNLIWSKPINNIYNNYGEVYQPFDIKSTQNNGVVFGGSLSFDNHNMGYLFNLNENINVINNNVYYYFPAEWVYRIIPIDDGSFILLVSAENLTGRTWLFRTNFDGSLPINEILSNEQYNVFPNPTQNDLNVRFYEVITGKITLTNIVGNEVWQKDVFNENSIVIPMNDYISGIYILSVQSQTCFYQHKICKN